jgi:hypothetical protein
MTTPTHKCVIAVIILLAAMRSFGQVHSQRIYAGGVSYYGDHCICSTPFRFGFWKYSYSNDARGFIITNSPGRTIQPGDTFHSGTLIYFGSTSFSVPMRPSSFLVVCVAALVFILVILVMVDFGLKYLRRRRYETLVV